MKIALVTRGFSLSSGGAERVSASLSLAFKKAGHSVTVFAERIGKDAPEGVEAVKVDVSKFFPSAIRHFLFNSRAAALVSKGDFDAVLGLCHFYPLDVYRASGGVHSHWMWLKYQNPVVRALKYVLTPVNLAVRKMEASIMAKGNHGLIITNSKLVKGHMRQYFGLSEQEVRVVYNGIDRNVFSPAVRKHGAILRKELGIASDKTVAAYVSNNWERKGLMTVLRALAVVKGLTVIVAGKGNIAKWRRTAAFLGVNEASLIFAGERKDIERIYGASDFFVLPTMYDPFSNACAEAMATALPVVTTRENGASEFITEGVNGFVMNEWNDAARLKHIFEELLSSGRAASMGRAAVDAVSGLTWERTMNETLTVCEEAAKLRRGR
ncbi:MAG: glycosyltransferase family 4 protein [Deltaproteobacteria bacterium]|nr:glycosyltransferase family 4 protein [Deltaproteobacteria bacterium]